MVLVMRTISAAEASACRRASSSRRKPRPSSTCAVEASYAAIRSSFEKAKAHLSALIEKVLAGEEVIIGKAGKLVARLVPFERPKRPRRPGALKGEIEIAPDFDELPEDIAEAFGMRPR